MVKKTLSLLVIFCMSFEQCFAQVASSVNLSSGLSALAFEKFRPVHLRSLQFNPAANSFEILLEKGDMAHAPEASVKDTAAKAMEYFQTGLSLPDDTFWVNLRPDASAKIIDPMLEHTDLGKVLLEADVALKKDMARACSPDTKEGKLYWDKLYAKAESLFGASVPVIPTLTRPWIVPGEIIVRQTNRSVYVYKAMLQVKLEQEHLKNLPEYSFSDPRMQELNGYSSSLIRELIIPGLNRKVNSSKTYASLRQVYYSLILSQWFKKHFRGSSAEFSNRIDSRDLTGLTSRVSWSKQGYFDQYRASFDNGEFNTRRNTGGVNGTTVRSYSSGGIIVPGGMLDGGNKQLMNVSPTAGRQVTSSAVVSISDIGKKDGGVDINRWIGEPFKAGDLNLDMFRDYDYRSTGFDLNPRMGFLFGIEWARMALAKAETAGISNRTVVLARDARKIEPELVEAVSDALRYMGLDVIYAAAEGPNSVTSYSWALQQYKPMMGIFLTASHVSRPANEKVRGFKVAMLTRDDRGVQSLTTREIKETSKAGIIKLMNNPGLIMAMKAKNEGQFIKGNVNENCVRMNALAGKVASQSGDLYALARELAAARDPLKVLESWERTYGQYRPLTGRKIVVEGAHTPSGILAAQTYESLGAETVLLNGDIVEVEGEHNADPSVEKNLIGLQQSIKAEGADMGIAFDLDGDRGAIVVPVKDSVTGGIIFETLGPDNMIVSMLPSLINEWGYAPSKTGKKVGVIRDVLGTFAVNEKAAQLGAEVFQTDAGYVFLKAKRENVLDRNYIVPIYGERSGHCWLDVTGEIENPIAVSVLFQVMVVQQLKQGEANPFYATYSRNTIPYLQSPRFQPAFHPALLQKLSSHPGNTSGWVFDPASSKNPPQVIIGLGKDEGVKALSRAFAAGTAFADGKIRVKEFNSYQDIPEEGGLYRFADIVFSDAKGDFCGRFVFRASSNDPTFVCSYEVPKRDKAAAMENLMMVGGSVLDWLEKNGFALVSVGSIAEQLNLSGQQAADKAKKLNLSGPEQHMNLYRMKFDGGAAITPGAMAVEMDFIMRMLGIKDYPRISETVKRSVNPVQFVSTLAAISGTTSDSVLKVLSKIDSFKPMAANYRVLTAGSFNPKEFDLKKVSVSVGADGYNLSGLRAELKGEPLSDYLSVMRELASTVPFVFRDDMEEYAGRFLGLTTFHRSAPDLQDLVDTLVPYLKGRDLGEIKYIVTSGIGANEMYSHQLAQILNASFKQAGIAVQWIVVNNPAHLNKIPADAVNGNTIVFEMSRSGTTKETVDLQNASLDRFRQRVVAANSGSLRENGIRLQEQGTGLVIDDTPGDIGGRQMNRKTLMVYAPLFIALAAGMKDTDKAQTLLKHYVAASVSANKELDYGNGRASEAIVLAETLLLQRFAGRNKWSVIFDESLRPESKALIQLNNEGGNKIGAAGSNNNILDSYAWETDQARMKKVFTSAPDTQLPIFLLNSNSQRYAEQLAYIEELRAKGIPAIVISVGLGDDLGKNLETMARTTALLQDMVVYFTYITQQDANSNPAVKMVREITAAMFDILKEKKSAGLTDLSIGFKDVMDKLAKKQEADRSKADASISAKNVQKGGGKEFQLFINDIKIAAADLGLPEAEVSDALIKTIVADVFKPDVGEAGGNKTAEIDEAFSRSGLNKELGTLAPGGPLAPLDEQVVLLKKPGMKISVAANSSVSFDFMNHPAATIAQYLQEVYRQRRAQWQYLTLTYMEADNQNPVIRQIAEDMTARFSDKNITTPLLALPGVAHTGIEAIMSHPESIFNIAIVYTDTYGEGLGTQLIEKGVTVDNATYVYGISNVIRMALAGTPNVIFEVENKEQLAEVQKIIRDALADFKQLMKLVDAEAAAGGQRDGGDEDEGLAGKKVGGIDFKSLPAKEVAAGRFDGALLSAKQLESAWKEIKLELVKGGVPCLKLKIYIATCVSQMQTSRLKAAATLITDGIKRDEDNAVATRPEVVRDILPLLG